MMIIERGCHRNINIKMKFVYKCCHTILMKENDFISRPIYIYYLGCFLNVSMYPRHKERGAKPLFECPAFRFCIPKI